MLPDLRIVIAAVVSTFIFTVGVGFFASSRLIHEQMVARVDTKGADDTPINRIALNWPEPTHADRNVNLDFAISAPPNARVPIPTEPETAPVVQSQNTAAPPRLDIPSATNNPAPPPAQLPEPKAAEPKVIESDVIASDVVETNTAEAEAAAPEPDLTVVETMDRAAPDSERPAAALEENKAPDSATPDTPPSHDRTASDDTQATPPENAIAANPPSAETPPPTADTNTAAAAVTPKGDASSPPDIPAESTLVAETPAQAPVTEPATEAAPRPLAEAAPPRVEAEQEEATGSIKVPATAELPLVAPVLVPLPEPRPRLAALSTGSETHARTANPDRTKPAAIHRKRPRRAVARPQPAPPAQTQRLQPFDLFAIFRIKPLVPQQIPPRPTTPAS